MPMYEYQDIYDWMKQNNQRKRPINQRKQLIEVLPKPQAQIYNQPKGHKKRRKYPSRRKKFLHRKRYGINEARSAQFREQNKMSKTTNLVGRRNVFGERTKKENKQPNRHNRPRLRLNDYKRLTTASPEIESIKFNINNIIAPLSPNPGSPETNPQIDHLNVIKTDSPEIESIKFNINKMISPLSPKIDVTKKKDSSSSTKMKAIKENEDFDHIISYTEMNAEKKNVVSDYKNIKQSERAKNHKMPNSSKVSSKLVTNTARTKFERENFPKEYEIENELKRMNEDSKLDTLRSKPESQMYKNPQIPPRYKVRRKRPKKPYDSFGE